MEIIILGSSNAIPTEGAENAHLMVVQNQHAVLIDCASNPLVHVPKAGIPFDWIDNLIFTHFHPDHVSGGPLLLMGLWLLGRKKKMHIFGLDHTISRFKTMMGLYEVDHWPGFFPIEYHTLEGSENEKVLEEGDLRVFSSPAKHLIPAIALKFESQGKSVVYSGDTGPTENLIRLARGCDLLIHEASGLSLGHSSPTQAARAALQAKAKALLLIHYPTQNGANQETLHEALSVFHGKVMLATDFMRLGY